MNTSKLIFVELSYTENRRLISSTSQSQPSARTMNQQRTSATSFGRTEYMFKKVTKPLQKSSRTPFTTLKNDLDTTRNVWHGYS
jgi:hypothetical protein